MNYFALDVETANADYSSICQIGIVHFQNGEMIDNWSSLVNPEAYFDPFNISIHGITEQDVINAPTFDKIHELVKEKINDQITVHHMPFDKVAIMRACHEYNLELIQPKWLDSAKIVRRTWEQFAYKGYGLANISNFLGIEFQHDDALEDAVAAARVVHLACEQTGMDIQEWVERVGQSNTLYEGRSPTIKLEGNPDGSFCGETLVFTGAMSLPRKEAAKIAANIGCSVVDSVTKKTTILVVGTQDTSKLAGYEKSSKHRKVEELIQKGNNIKILSEKDFIETCNQEIETLKLELPRTEHPIKVEKKEASKSSSKMSAEISIDESFIQEEISKVWDNLTEEERELLKKADDDYKQLIDSINDLSHSEKRTIGSGFRAVLAEIKNNYDKIYLEPFSDDDMELINYVDSEVDQLQEILYDLIKDKISLAEFFESIYNSIDYIETELEDNIFEAIAVDFSMTTLTKLKSIKEQILTHSNIL